MTNRPGRGNCAACEHPDRDQLDIDIEAGGESLRSIAGRFEMSEGALRRHRRNHRNKDLAALTASRPATVARRGDDMGAELAALLDRTETFLVAAEETGNASAAMAAIRELRGLWELWGKATGALRDRHEVVVVDLVRTQEWIELSSELFTILSRHPDALADVQDALRLEAPA